MLLKTFAKKLTPGIVRKYLRMRRDKRFEKEFLGLSNKEVFEKIYEEKLWGSSDSEARKYSSGDGSRDQWIVDNYVEAIKSYLGHKSELRSALDLGCGDFTVGSRLVDYFKEYTAVDVAENVISENRKIYQNENLSFKALNITEDELPEADVVFVRQVLQHLSNKEIQKFLQNIKGKFKRLIVTESISQSRFFTPNKDIISGPGIRIHKKSGVVIEDPPFNFQSSDVEIILNFNKGREFFMTKVYSN